MLPLASRLTLSLGPAVAHFTTRRPAGRLISATRPYGSEPFGQLGATAGIRLDTRDVPANARRGVLLSAGASAHPAGWDVRSAFADVHAEAAGYLTARIPLRPTLALRAAARRVLGDYPFHEAAFIGGPSSVRGFSVQRFAGDAAAFGNAELRLTSGRTASSSRPSTACSHSRTRGACGCTGSTPTPGTGAPAAVLWLAYLERANAVNVAVARCAEGTGVLRTDGVPLLSATGPPAPSSGALVRALRVFGHVETTEAWTVVLLGANLFVLLAAYYVLKTVREPLILASGGAELKSYAAAFQAATLVGFVPAYSWLTSRLNRARLVVVVVLFFAVMVELFFAGSLLAVPHLGFGFFVFVGIFSNATIALFWSYANDLYGPETGARLFPVIALGAALGSPVGSKLAEWLFSGGVSPYRMLHVGAALLLLHLGLYLAVDRRERRRQRATAAGPPLTHGPGGFGLVLRSPYLRLVAALLVLLNVVNTLGEYVLSRSVVHAARAAAAADPTLDVPGYIGAFYGGYFFWVNIASVLLQAFVASRLVKRFGVPGVILALPLVALGAYGLVAAGVGLAVIRWAKTAENAVDYSIMNTGKQMLWLPTRREEKYSAKQAVDSFFVRTGDLLAAGAVYAGTTWLGAGIRGFGAANLLVVLLWAATALAVLRHHRALSAPRL